MQWEDELRGRIGRETEFAGADEVSLNDIRRKLEVYCFDCPLYFDETVARSHGYRTVVAPTTLTPLWAMPAYWRRGESSPWARGEPEHAGGIRFEAATPFSKAVNTGSRWEYFEPLYPGDRLRGTSKLIDVKPRTTRLGEGVFLEFETSIFKHSGEHVAVNRNTLYRYNARADATDEKREMPTLKEPVAGRLENIARPSDWSRQIRFRDVRIEDDVPAFSLSLTYQRIVMSTAADRMFSGIHHNRDQAREAGLPDIIFNTRGYETFFEVSLRNWIGLDGKMTKLGPFRMGAPSCPGDTIICRSRVVAKEQRHDQGIIRIEIVADNDKGEAARGEAEVVLPL